MSSPPSPHAAHLHGLRRLRLLVILGSLSAFGPLSIDMYLPALPSLARDLAAPPWAIQLSLTGCVVGLALGQLVAGPLSDARGRRPPLLVGLAVYAVASLLCALAPSAGVLLALRVLQGLAGSAGIVIARAIVRDLYSGVELARFFSLLLLVNGLAPILAPILGAQLIRVTSWRGVFLVLAAIGILLLVAAAAWLPETVPRARRREGGLGAVLGTFGLLARDRTFLGYALSAGLVFASLFAYIAGSPFVIQGIYGVSAQGFSGIFAVNALGIMATAQAGGRLVRRTGPFPLLVAGLCTSATGGIGLLLAVLSGAGLPGILPALFLVAASMGLVMPNAMALALHDHPTVAGSASAVLGALQYVVGGVVAPLVGLGGAGTALPMAVTIACTSVAAGTVLATLRRGTRPAGVDRTESPVEPPGTGEEVPAVTRA